MREVRRLKIEELLTNAEITARTGIPDKTIRRYLSEIYQQENEVLQHPTSEELAVDVAVFREKVTRQIRQILAYANSPDCEHEMKLSYHNWALDAEWLLLKLSYHSVSEIAKILQLSTSIKFVEMQRRPSLEQIQ